MQGSGTAKLTSPGAALGIPGSTPHKLNARYITLHVSTEAVRRLVCRLLRPILQTYVPYRQVLLVLAVT